MSQRSNFFRIIVHMTAGSTIILVAVFHDQASSKKDVNMKVNHGLADRRRSHHSVMRKSLDRIGDEERRLMHLVPAPAVRLMKRRVLSRPGQR